MLYDTRWDKSAATPATIFGLEPLIAWLETKPPGECYDPCIPKQCLFGQYFAARGRQDNSHLSLMATTENSVNCDIAFGKLDDIRWTFGAALERAREALENGAVA